MFQNINMLPFAKTTLSSPTLLLLAIFVVNWFNKINKWKLGKKSLNSVFQLDFTPNSQKKYILIVKVW